MLGRYIRSHFTFKEPLLKTFLIFIVTRDQIASAK